MRFNISLTLSSLPRVDIVEYFRGKFFKLPASAREQPLAAPGDPQVLASFSLDDFVPRSHVPGILQLVQQGIESARPHVVTVTLQLFD
jgi:hypothetical protein